jgi:hypothetical protein
MARFIVDYTFKGRTSSTIEASSQEEALERVAEEINRDDFTLDADEIDDVDFDVREMHPVTRAGREIWTTFVWPTDTRGHQSALKDSPLFADRPPAAQAQEAA